MAKVPKRGQHITANFTKAEMHEIGEYAKAQGLRLSAAVHDGMLVYLKLLRGMLPPADMRSGVGFAKLNPQERLRSGSVRKGER